ncbi:hotdog fold thioesterase [Nocardioides albidus]|uniref:Hotdog fold thioesterase n=1 Tax=Nocardioides albidus TaxID=1517589 RepID=A0A5C4W522_9ACTN|nr:hotdog fold thioesterase [Nocardioides albidus]
MTTDASPDQYADEIADLMRANMGALNERMGIELLEVSPDRVVGTMPVDGNTQPYGLLHGGASVVLAETLGSTAAALHAGPDRYAVGVDINATHHRSATKGLVTGVTTPLHRGRSMASFEIVVSDEDGRRVCTSRITCALLERDPGKK